MSSRATTHLALILDRTCPDRDSWSDARLLPSDPYAFRDEQTRRPLYPDFNRSLREGLVAGLKGFSAPIHLAWFADRYGEGIAAIEGLDLPPTLAGELGPFPADELEANLRHCTYSPGLDLWDPLGEALALVGEPLLRQPASVARLLIVGNSPPDLPLEGDSPFYDLLEMRGLSTTARRRNGLFTRWMRELKARAIPAHYLFLVHDRSTDAADGDELLYYRAMQDRIARALGHYLSVVTVSADREGVAAGLARILSATPAPTP